MTEDIRNQLLEIWAYCDAADKSTEYMLTCMEDIAGEDFDAVEFILNTSDEERDDWYKGNADWHAKYPELNN